MTPTKSAPPRPTRSGSHQRPRPVAPEPEPIDLQLTDGMLESLLSSSKWANVLAIFLLFVGVAAIAFSYSLFRVREDNPGGANPAALWLGILRGVVILAVSLRLSAFATALRRLRKPTGLKTLGDVFEAQRRFWAGAAVIVLIVVLSLLEPLLWTR